MEKIKKVWFNGKLINPKKSNIHILTHSLHYGSGVFEGIRAYDTSEGSAVFRLNEHIERFFYSVSVLEMKLLFSKKEIKKAILDLIRINNLKNCYIRPIAFYGQKMGLLPTSVSTDIAIIVWQWNSYLGEKPIKTIISKFIRLHPKSVVSDAKVCGYYANSVFASLDARKRKADEAILLDYKGKVAEGPGENIFMVKNNSVFTPKKESILPGITRDTIITVLNDWKVKVKEKDISAKELKSADEVFFTGTAVEICPVGKINKTLINKGKVGSLTKIIQEFYQGIIRGKEKKYLKWLTYVKS